MRPIIAARGAADAETDITRVAALTRQRPPHRADNTVLHRLLEISVHRQADDLIGEPLADRHAAVGHRTVAIGRLAVQRLAVIDRGRDALRLERCAERVAPALGWKKAASAKISN